MPSTPARPHDQPDLLVVTPWYPTDDNPYYGTFVRETVRTLQPHYRDIMIVHVENRPLDDTRAPVWRDAPEGRVLWIGVPMDPMTSRADMMLRQREALSDHVLPYLQHARLVHCHAGAPTGAALVPLLPESTRLVLTEHATYLPLVFRNPDAKAMYADLLRRADVFTTVSRGSAATIRTAFPDLDPTITIIANPVWFDHFPLKAEIGEELRRWLYVGNLYAHKGVRRLVRAFAAWCDVDPHPDNSLRLVGDGVLRDELAELAAELGVSDRVIFHGGVAPDEVGALMGQHDVLVHLSHVETFGLTCVEAAACGLPVIATESGGPEDTLIVHEALGYAGLCPVSDEHDIEPVLEIATRLQRTLEPDKARVSRAFLKEAYQPETIGARFREVLEDEPVPVQPAREGMRVLTIALTAKEARNAEGVLQTFCEFGGGGVYITARPVHATFPDTVRIIDISGIERATPLYRAERTLVLRAPAAVLRAAGKAVRVARPALGGRAAGLASRVSEAQRTHQQCARDIRHGHYDKVWRNLGPWWAARQMERTGAFDAIDLSQVDCLHTPDEFVTALAYRILQRRPELEVRRRWTRRAVARLYVDKVLLPAMEGSGAHDDTLPVEAAPRGSDPYAGLLVETAPASTPRAADRADHTDHTAPTATERLDDAGEAAGHDDNAPEGAPPR